MFEIYISLIVSQKQFFIFVQNTIYLKIVLIFPLRNNENPLCFAQK